MPLYDHIMFFVANKLVRTWSYLTGQTNFQLFKVTTFVIVCIFVPGIMVLAFQAGFGALGLFYLLYVLSGVINLALVKNLEEEIERFRLHEGSNVPRVWVAYYMGTKLSRAIFFYSSIAFFVMTFAFFASGENHYNTMLYAAVTLLTFFCSLTDYIALEIDFGGKSILSKARDKIREKTAIRAPANKPLI